MIREDYISFEIAKLLKEKGFDEPCRMEYHFNGTQLCDKDTGRYYSDVGIDTCTHQLAMKWLREKGFEVVVIPVWQTLSKVYRSYVLSDLGNKYKDFHDSYSDNITYEEAVEAACLYALKNLV